MRRYVDDPQDCPDYEGIAERLGMPPGSTIEAIERRCEDLREDNMAAIAEGAIYDAL